MVKMCRERVEATGKILVRKVETSVNFFFFFFSKTNYIKTKTNIEHLIKIGMLHMVVISSEMQLISNIGLISGLLKK